MKKKTILQKLNRGTLSSRVYEMEEVTNSGSRASFYGKAKQGRIKVGGTVYRVLKSYDTYTALLSLSDLSLYFEEHSATSDRHLKGFLFTDETLAELRKRNDAN